MSSIPYGNGPGGPGPSDMMGQLNRAMAALQSGNLSEAEMLLKLVLAGNKRQFEAMHFLGVIAAQRGRLEEAADLIGKSLKLDATKSEAFSNYARVLNELKRHQDALVSSDKALALSRGNITALLARGNALLGLGRLAEALESYDKALMIRRDYIDAMANRSHVLNLLGRYGDALETLDRALALAPNHVPSVLNRGRALQGLGRADEAIRSYERALALAPGHPDAQVCRADALVSLGRNEEALASYAQALAQAPGDERAAIGRGNLLRDMGRYAESAAFLQQVVEHHPTVAEARYHLGLSLAMQGFTDRAATEFEQALRLAPDHDRARFDLCMVQLPVLYETEAEIAERRAAYSQHLQQMCAQAIPLSRMSTALMPIGALQPFYLPYQGRNDRELQSIYGAHVCRIMAELFPPAPMPAPPRADEPVRVGFVSGLFEAHSVWKIPTKGWLSQLDRRKFRVFGYNTAASSRAEEASALCERFVRGPMTIERWRAEILADAPHVLIYPEIGMDTASAHLAALRLAPVQCLGLGHPETTGYGTLDYFLSSALMEPAGSEAQYTERLVRLPNLSIYYEPVPTIPVPLRRGDFGLRPDATVFWSCQSLYKFLPQHDEVFPRIAREAGNCQFAFVAFQQDDHTTSRFRARLERAFAAFGLQARDYCVILPRFDQQQFIAFAGLCDIVLDSIAWSGFNTTLETLASDLPVVTLPGEFARARHTAAVLEMIGVTDTIAASLDQYVEMAVRLARDPAWRDQIKTKMRERKARIYRDRSAIRALEEFLDRAARTAQS